MKLLSNYAKRIESEGKFVAIATVDTDGLLLLKLEPNQGYFSAHVQIQVYSDEENQEIIVASTEQQTFGVYTWTFSTDDADCEAKLFRYLESLLSV